MRWRRSSLTRASRTPCCSSPASRMASAAPKRSSPLWRPSSPSTPRPWTSLTPTPPCSACTPPPPTRTPPIPPPPRDHPRPDHPGSRSPDGAAASPGTTPRGPRCEAGRARAPSAPESNRPRATLPRLIRGGPCAGRSSHGARVGLNSVLFLLFRPILEPPCLPMGTRPDASPRELGGAGFTHHGHPDLPRIGQLLLDLLGHIAGDHLRLNVIDPIRLHHDPDLPPGLHREHLVHAVVRGRDLLQAFQPLDIGLQ